MGLNSRFVVGSMSDLGISFRQLSHNTSNTSSLFSHLHAPIASHRASPRATPEPATWYAKEERDGLDKAWLNCACFFGRVLVDWRAAHLLSLEEVLSLSLQQNALPLLPQALQAQADRGYTLQDWQHICCEEEGGPRCCRASEETQHEEVRRHGSHHTRA